ncbi:MAG: hypothetical protein IT270_15555 [Saprospiraceae bacterium]|nr:hypothetical protein [Saprospiraceae bacterium]
MSHDLKVRYSDEDLQEFKVLIDEKLVKAQEELDFTQQQISELNENGFNQQGGDWYDDSTAHTDLELLQRMAQRQQRHIQDLRNALLRIQNKTYGVCSVTGQLIDKQRLRLVPHATKSIDGKNIANANAAPSGDTNVTTSAADPFLDDSERPAAKPVADKVRLPNAKRTRPGASNDDWEADNETLEDSGYTNKKFDDDEE